MTERVEARTRWARHRVRQEDWKARNRERYLEQKRRCAAHPDYLALRRSRYKARSVERGTYLSTKENDNDTIED